MCGITAIFNIREGVSALRGQALEMSKRIRHRGPDWSGIYQGRTAILAHERLSIVDPASGGQPLKSKDGKLILTVNGEIYNHREIREALKGEYEFMTGSDCEVILALYRKYGTGCVERLSGIFAFALYDEENDTYLIARDPIGVIPLYMGYDDHGHLLVSSELKGLEGFATIYDQFKPGHYFYSKDTDLTKWYIRDWMDYENVKDNPASIEELHDALEAAVQRQLMSDVPYGVLLSGGLDSSITSAIAKKYAAKRIETGGKADAWWPQLHSFAIGLKGAPDRRPQGSRCDRNRPPRDQLHDPGRSGRPPRRYLLYRDLRCNDRTCFYPDVSPFPRHQKHGYQNGFEWRRSRRSVRWLSVFPQSTGCQGIPRRDIA